MLFSERIWDRKIRWQDKSKRPNVIRERRLNNKTAAAVVAADFGLFPAATIRKIPNIFEFDGYDQLPANYVLKPNAGSNNRGVFIVKDGMDVQRESVVSTKFVQNVLGTLDKSKFGKEFVVEELIEDWNSSVVIPHDFKFYVFGSHVEIVHIVDRNHHRPVHRFFDHELQPLKYQVQRSQLHSPARYLFPTLTTDMVKRASEIGRAFGTFIRVDLYASSKGIKFGEFTPFPHGGQGYTDFADQHLGQLWATCEKEVEL